MRKPIIFAVLFAGILSIAACKKDESTDSTPNLSGLYFTEEAIPYVAVGEDVTLRVNPNKIITSDGSSVGTIGLYWQVNSANRDTLTRDVAKENPDFKYHVDTLGTYQVACYAFAGDDSYHYYNASAVTSFQAIDPVKSLTGLALKASVTIGGKEWSARNLANNESGASYKKAGVVDNLFGRLYSWEEASVACPAGWHLPTAEEWDAINEDVSALMAPAQFLDVDMWEPAISQSITNESGFNAIPVGYLDNTASLDKYRRYGEMAAFWTASDATSDASLAQFRFILYDNSAIMKGNGDKSSLALSVRCVKN